MPQDWSEKEVELTIADYFQMLNDELLGRSYNKSFRRKELLKLLNNRTESSIEFKHQNISAALASFGLPFIRGYKPRWNYQKVLLEKKISEFLKINFKDFEQGFKLFAETVPEMVKSKISFDAMVVAPPKIEEVAEPREIYKRRQIKINYLQREQENQELGKRGESLVLQYEKWKLNEIGFYNLSEKVELVSGYDDGAGFDILSKNPNGTDKYIEVKTTKLAKETPIYFSSNEYRFSIENEANYHLYRVFDLGKSPRFFTVKGGFDSFCRKEPVQYRGWF
ncbi:DUF3883 domain-containing protein [Algoriphagus sp. NBT04N3]|jgi:hypothetical protein|uniref:DUF3883 domain-containing protein n=1 Tax=Algoriphagus sp. NBT04N3 TaxID=2705473 RepID=UPI001C633A7A|nr:DUF3883 domain-containing protein [Algoriphagus sp. NBT04N3]QYH38465.1 DUF3883 domain-containing protein [Algoriphagus sp. NBT04N3]